MEKYFKKLKETVKGAVLRECIAICERNGYVCVRHDDKSGIQAVAQFGLRRVVFRVRCEESVWDNDLLLSLAGYVGKEVVKTANIEHDEDSKEAYVDCWLREKDALMIGKED